MPANLAPVYLDDARIGLQGDPQPSIAKILAAGGQDPAGVQVIRLREHQGADGLPLHAEDVVDRTLHTTTPIHLRTVARETKGSTGPAKTQSQVPGDIVRGTEATAEAGEQAARAGQPTGNNPRHMLEHSQDQSFADPVHKGGSPRTAEAVGDQTDTTQEGQE